MLHFYYSIGTRMFLPETYLNTGAAVLPSPERLVVRLPTSTKRNEHPERIIFYESMVHDVDMSRVVTACLGDIEEHRMCASVDSAD